jgi:hypothetical protein
MCAHSSTTPPVPSPHEDASAVEAGRVIYSERCPDPLRGLGALSLGSMHAPSRVASRLGDLMRYRIVIAATMVPACLTVDQSWILFGVPLCPEVSDSFIGKRALSELILTSSHAFANAGCSFCLAPFCLSGRPPSIGTAFYHSNSAARPLHRLRLAPHATFSSRTFLLVRTSPLHQHRLLPLKLRG